MIDFGFSQRRHAFETQNSQENISVNRLKQSKAQNFESVGEFLVGKMRLLFVVCMLLTFALVSSAKGADSASAACDTCCNSYSKKFFPLPKRRTF